MDERERKTGEKLFNGYKVTVRYEESILPFNCRAE
jgi:hypothetical protein